MVVTTKRRQVDLFLPALSPDAGVTWAQVNGPILACGAGACGQSKWPC